LGCITDGDLPIFQVYSTGKAQEIIKIINSLTKVPVLVHPIVEKVNQAYEKNGVKLIYTCSNSEEGKELLRSKQCVFIVPNHYKTFPTQSYSLATASGWVLKYRSRKFSGAFPLSGHADFNQLVNYVKKVKPKQVFTIHGNQEYFSKYLSRELGTRAYPITSINQKPLQEYL